MQMRRKRKESLERWGPERKGTERCADLVAYVFPEEADGLFDEREALGQASVCFASC